MRTGIPAMVCIAASTVFLSGSMAGAQSGAVQARDATVEIILSHLPLKTSRAFFALRKIAGNPAGEILPMTKSEVWRVQPQNLRALGELAAKSGVTTRIVGTASINALAPMPENANMTGKQAQMMHEVKQRKSTMGIEMMALPEAPILEYALMHRAGDGPAAIKIALNRTTTITVHRTSVAQEGDRYLWHGAIAGTDEPVTLIWWPQGRLTGTILHAGRVYTVQSMGGGMHAVIENDPKMLPSEHAPMDPDMKTRMNMTTDPLVKNGDAHMLMDKPEKHGEPVENLKNRPPVGKQPLRKPASTTGAPSTQHAAPITITLIVAYTAAAAARYTDIRRDLIELAVAETNQSFRESGIDNVRVKLVHGFKANYAEAGSHFDHLLKFAERGDGVMDEIHLLRDKYRADVALLIVDDSNGCGLSAGVAPEADRAFAVVHHGCAASVYSLGHEIGHIIGARHDLGLDDSEQPFAYGHGFVNGNKWRTMMGYEHSCDGCPRLPVWSNPNVMIKGEAAGSKFSNNARVIREQAARVAAFR